jgi:hypothetical protein
VVSDPNALFYCGDTAQTISRGIAFRFTDIRTLLWEEGQRRETAAALVKGPPPIKGGSWEVLSAGHHNRLVMLTADPVIGPCAVAPHQLVS